MMCAVVAELASVLRVLVCECGGWRTCVCACVFAVGVLVCVLAVFVVCYVGAWCVRVLRVHLRGQLCCRARLATVPPTVVRVPMRAVNALVLFSGLAHSNSTWHCGCLV